MEAGDRGGDDRGGVEKSPQRGKMQLMVCDLTSDDFEETWQKLKELHDKDLHCLQTKLTNLMREQATKARTRYTAKIKKLTVQQQMFKGIIRDLQDQLNAKKCKCCTMNETRRNTLQQEFNNIQEKNTGLIAKLTAKRNKLKEENKRLREKLKVYQPHLHASFSDSDDDSDSDTQIAIPAIALCSGQTLTSGTQGHLPVKLVQQSNTEKMMSGGQKGVQHRSNSPVPFDSRDLFAVPETPFETTPSNARKPASGGSANQQSTRDSPSTFTLGPQREYGLQGVSHLPKLKLTRSERKQISTQGEIQTDFSWSLSSISSGSPELLAEENPTPLVSETSEEDMPHSDRRTCHPPQKKAEPSFTAFPFDSTLKCSGKRSTIGDSQHNIGLLVKDGSYQAPSSEQSALREKTDESAGAQCGADKPQGDTHSFNVRYSLKRKAKIQSRR